MHWCAKYTLFFLGFMRVHRLEKKRLIKQNQVPYSTCAENCSITNVHVAYPTCLFCFIMAVPSFFRDGKYTSSLASITPNLLCRLFYTVQFFLFNTLCWFVCSISSIFTLSSSFFYSFFLLSALSSSVDQV